MSATAEEKSRAQMLRGFVKIINGESHQETHDFFPSYSMNPRIALT